MGRLLSITVSLLLVAFSLITEAAFSARGSIPLQIIGFLKGPLKGDFLGTAVAPAGDVNQDGYADFLAAAGCKDGCQGPGNPVGSFQVYLYYGGPGIVDTVPDVTFPYAARTLVTLSDINGDDLPDYAFWPGDSSPVKIYYGGNPPDTVPDLVFTPEFPRDQFGFQIASGDVNGANGRDILITSPSYPNNDLFFNGRGYLFHNNAVGGIDSSADWTVTGAGLAQNQLDLGVGSIITDFNGDGFADVLMGELGAGSSPGSISIFLGRTNPSTIPDVTFYRPDQLFGITLSAVGDLNNDGFGDFATTRLGGFPLVYFGGNPVDTLPDLILDRRAEVLAPGGDINHDGFSDLLTGFPLGQNFLTGLAYVYFGGPNMDNKADVVIDEADLPVPAPDFGQALAGVGDINGDGIDDFIVGAEEGIADSTDRGQVWVFAGDSDLVSTDVEDGKPSLPRNFSLQQNYPNPFNSSTLISYTLSRRAPVRLEIFNIAGQLVKVLVDEEQSAGNHRVSWEGKDSKGRPMPSGIYLYKLSFEGEVQVKKMVLVK